MLNQRYLESYAKLVHSRQKDRAYSLSEDFLKKEKDANEKWAAFYRDVFIDSTRPSNDPYVLFYRENYKLLNDIFAPVK